MVIFSHLHLESQSHLVDWYLIEEDGCILIPPSWILLISDRLTPNRRRWLHSHHLGSYFHPADWHMVKEDGCIYNLYLEFYSYFYSSFTSILIQVLLPLLSGFYFYSHFRSHSHSYLGTYSPQATQQSTDRWSIIFLNDWYSFISRKVVA